MPEEQISKLQPGTPVLEYVPHPTVPRERIQRFADSGIQASVNSTLAAAGAGKNGVLLNLEKNPTGLNAAIAVKLNDHWTIVQAFRRDDWGNTFATAARWSW